ncbi:MAG: type II toxin-antitoxin system HicA family toxin [Verrucomicrobiota bacterium]
MCRLLEGQGFVEIRQRGSHRILQLWTGESTRTIPVPMHNDLKPGTLAAIIRQSGLDRARFE